jgi:hypothetical protein
MNSILKKGIFGKTVLPMFHVGPAALLLALLVGSTGILSVGAWAQNVQSNPDSGQAVLYQRASAKLEEAERHLNAGGLTEAKETMKEANALFTVLQQDSGDLLAERTLTPKEEQQFAINRKLGEDAQLQGDRLMETAAAKQKQGEDLQAQGQEEAGDKLLSEAQMEYQRAQQFYVRAGIFALKNQQLLFRFLAQ